MIVKVLDVQYHGQADNDSVDAYTECNVTSVSMVLQMGKNLYPHATDEYMASLLKSNEAQKHAKKLIREGNSWIRSYLSSNKLRLVWSMLNWSARYVIGDGDPEKGKPYSNFFTTLPLGAIRREIDLGYPVILSGNFYNLNRTMRYDHIMVAVGWDEFGFICHDPAGDLFRGKGEVIDYNAKYFNGVSGAYVHYPYEWMYQCLSGSRDLKWGLLIHPDKNSPIEVALPYTIDVYRKI